MKSILSDISELVRTSSPRLIVLNPTNPSEDLSERWDTHPASYRQFCDRITEFDAQWAALLRTRGIDKITKILEDMFGEELAKTVIEKQAADVESARSHNQLRIEKSSGFIAGVVGPSTIPVPRNQFYGEKA